MNRFRWSRRQPGRPPVPRWTHRRTFPSSPRIARQYPEGDLDYLLPFLPSITAKRCIRTCVCAAACAVFILGLARGGITRGEMGKSSPPSEMNITASQGCSVPVLPPLKKLLTCVVSFTTNVETSDQVARIRHDTAHNTVNSSAGVLPGFHRFCLAGCQQPYARRQFTCSTKRSCSN